MLPLQVVATTLQLHSLLEDEAARSLAAPQPTSKASSKAKDAPSKVLKGNK